MKNSDILTFDINLLLPQSPYPLYIPELVTYLPLFTQQFGDLSPNFNFGKITLEGPASPISVTVRPIIYFFIYFYTKTGLVITRKHDLSEDITG